MTTLDDLTIKPMKTPELAEGEMGFFIAGEEFLRFKPNGDIYVKGRLTDNDMAVVDGLREWMLASGMLKPDAVYVESATVEPAEGE